MSIEIYKDEEMEDIKLRIRNIRIKKMSIINITLTMVVLVCNIMSTSTIIFASEPDKGKEVVVASSVNNYYNNLISLIEESMQEENQSTENRNTAVILDDSSLALKKEEKLKEIGVCSYSSTKSYEDGSGITDRTSKQYWLLQEMYIDERGFYVTQDGYIGVALGSYYGGIGTKYQVTLDTGIELRVIKADEKADKDVINGCYHKTDGSILEFINDYQTAAQYYGLISNEFILNGNYNNHDDFTGTIISMKKVIE